MSDLDLLTRADDLRRIRAIVADLGYAEEPYDAALLPTRLRDPLRREWKFVASRGGFPVLIEVRAEPLDPGLPPPPDGTRPRILGPPACTCRPHVGPRAPAR